jgi:hypothetical protein
MSHKVAAANALFNNYNYEFDLVYLFGPEAAAGAAVLKAAIPIQKPPAAFAVSVG